MKHTFYLKEANSKSQSLIYFSCYFKKERKKFVYSTGERLLPKSWDKKNNRPLLKGVNKAQNFKSIIAQLNRYSHKFDELQERFILIGEEFTSNILRREFDNEFKKEPTSDNYFFDTYDRFISYNKKMNVWKPATLIKYNNIKKLLEEFEFSKKYKLTFTRINNEFISEFTNYCYSTKKHSINTFRRNLGLFKTFMNWAFLNKHTYNDEYQKFKKPKPVITKQIALSLPEIKEIYNKEFDNKSYERVRDVFIFQCLTGLRHQELMRVNKSMIKDDHLYFSENKDVHKVERMIPLTKVSHEILEKYDYKLPVLSNQKYNDKIKKVVEECKINYDVEITTVKGKMQTHTIKKVFDLIASHTARRSFITNMRERGVPDKTIMSITGHVDLKTFVSYHKVNDISKLDAVNNVYADL